MIKNTHISDDIISSFRSGSLSAEDTINCAEHLELCFDCNLRFGNVLTNEDYPRAFILDFSPKTYLTDEHLDYEQLSDYLEDKLDEDEAEIVNVHIGLCLRCRKDLLSLKDFRRSIEPELRLRYASPTLLNRLAEYLGLTGRPRIIIAYSTLITLIVMGCLVLTIHLRRNQKSTTDTSLAPSPSPVTNEIPPVKSEVKKESPQLHSVIEDRKRNTIGRGEPGAVVGIYDNGRWYRLDHNGNPTGLKAIPADLRADVADLLRGRSLSAPVSLNELTGPEISERGVADNQERLVLLSPLETLIEEDRPLFKWNPLKGATSYEVQIVDDEFNLVMQSPGLAATEWSVTKPLMRDNVYMWQVIAYKAGEIIESQTRQTGRFRIISAKKLREIESARKIITSRLALGVYYFREGLLYNAQREFQVLVNTNPDSEIARNIFRKIQTRSAPSSMSK